MQPHETPEWEAAAQAIIAFAKLSEQWQQMETARLEALVWPTPEEATLLSG